MKIRPRIRLDALAILVVGLLVALPVLGLDCEMACAGMGRPPGAVPASHCPAHQDSRGSGPADAPSTPDRCGHHEDSPAVKIAIESAGARLAASTVADVPPSASTLPDRRFFLADGTAPIQARSASSHLSRVLRL